MKRRLNSKISDSFEVRRAPHIGYFGNLIESNSSNNSNGRKFLLPFCYKFEPGRAVQLPDLQQLAFTETMQDFSDVKTELWTRYPAAEK